MPLQTKQHALLFRRGPHDLAGQSFPPALVGIFVLIKIERTAHLSFRFTALFVFPKAAAFTSTCWTNRGTHDTAGAYGDEHAELYT